jgi:hypothetical protein
LFCDMTPFNYALEMFHNDAIIEIAGPTYCLLDDFSTGMRRQKIRPDGSIASVRYCKPKSRTPRKRCGAFGSTGRSHK